MDELQKPVPTLHTTLNNLAKVYLLSFSEDTCNNPHTGNTKDIKLSMAVLYQPPRGTFKMKTALHPVTPLLYDTVRYHLGQSSYQEVNCSF